MALWQQLKTGNIVPEINEDVTSGLHTRLRSGADCKLTHSNMIARKDMIDDAVKQISKLWDEVEHSGGTIAWEWILRKSHHGAKIRSAEEHVDTIGSRGDPAALASACNDWVATWRNGIEAWKKI